MPETRLAICIPSNDTWRATTGLCLAALTHHWAISPPDDCHPTLELFNIKGSILISNRSELVRQALKAEATHILWLDSDMRFPADTPHRLLQHNIPIVAANCRRRTPPFEFTASDGYHERIPTNGDSTGLQEVGYVGMAVMLTSTEVFKDWPEPWFQFGWDTKRNDYVGEDVYFCSQARRQGYATRIDHDLSKEIWHIGEVEVPTLDPAMEPQTVEGWPPGQAPADYGPVKLTFDWPAANAQIEGEDV